MVYKNIIITTFLIISVSFNIYSQEPPRFMDPTLLEQKMLVYEKDSTSGAVYLRERGDNYFKLIDHRVWLVKDYYAKIKIFNSSEFDQAIIKIPVYKGNKDRERVENIKAVTHNGKSKQYLSSKNIFTKNINEHWDEVTFTFPNVKEGSILEYEYSLISPFFFNFNGWEFQSNIPKLYSEFTAEIPGNYVYNRTLNGYYKLDKNDAHIKKRCFKIDGYDAADCEVLTYTMKEIPAFHEEDYLTSRKNFISKLNFELSEYMGFDGIRKRFTKTWKNVDKEFRTNKEIGRQIKRKAYFKDVMPDSLLTISDDLKRAQKVFDFIQSHYSWNGKYSIFLGTDVKKAFEERTGSVGDLNLSLINALQAANIKTEIVVLSTRENGLPTRLHPVISDFNYLIARATISGKEYLLDITDKLLPFGVIPFKCLNSIGRVMDFKNDSYWINLYPHKKNTKTVSVRLTLSNEGIVHGDYRETNTGYLAHVKRLDLEDQTLDEYLNQKEEVFNDSEISDYKIKNKNITNKPLTEEFKVSFSSLFGDDETFINPFIIKSFKENPFKFQHRNYPVDFGHPSVYTYRFAIELPANYTISEIPESKAFSLGDDIAIQSFQINKISDHKLTLQYKTKINKYFYTPDMYEALRDFFSKIVEIQNNTLLNIKKNK